MSHEIHASFTSGRRGFDDQIVPRSRYNHARCDHRFHAEAADGMEYAA